MAKKKYALLGFRPTEKIQSYIDSELQKNPQKTKTEIIIDLLESTLSNSGEASEKQEGKTALPSTQKQEPFNYEGWYPDCEFGTYFKDKKKVHCACSYPSVKKWLPKDRLVEPQVCETCKPRIDNIKDFIQNKDEEKRALAHTGKYFTDEQGRRIFY